MMNILCNSRRPLVALALVVLGAAAHTAPSQQVVVIGDSLSAEYAGVPYGTAPRGGRAYNWVEILAAQADPALDFGSPAAGYLDARLVGYSYNWAFPGFTAESMANVIRAGFPSTFPSYADMPAHLQNDAERVVVMLGANDFNSEYGTYYNGQVPVGFAERLEENFHTILGYLHEVNQGRFTAGKPRLQVLVSTIIDVGITPDVRDDHPNAAQRAVATEELRKLNQRIRNAATVYGFAIVDLFEVSQQIADQPVLIGGREIIHAASANNDPAYLFCHDGFHPGTMGQALIAKMIVEGFNSAFDVAASPLTEREMLTFAGMTPTASYASYYSWATPYALANDDATADPDADGLPSVVEFALGLNPAVSSADLAPRPVAATHNGNPVLALTYTQSAASIGALDIIARTCSDLQTWTNVPASWIDTTTAPAVTIRMPIGTAPGYLKLSTKLR